MAPLPGRLPGLDTLLLEQLFNLFPRRVAEQFVTPPSNMGITAPHRQIKNDSQALLSQVIVWWVNHLRELDWQERPIELDETYLLPVDTVDELLGSLAQAIANVAWEPLNAAKGCLAGLAQEIWKQVDSLGTPFHVYENMTISRAQGKAQLRRADVSP